MARRVGFGEKEEVRARQMDNEELEGEGDGICRGFYMIIEGGEGFESGLFYFFSDLIELVSFNPGEREWVLKKREREREMMVRRCRSFVFFFFWNDFFAASVVGFGF